MGYAPEAEKGLKKEKSGNSAADTPSEMGGACGGIGEFVMVFQYLIGRKVGPTYFGRGR